LVEILNQEPWTAIEALLERVRPTQWGDATNLNMVLSGGVISSAGGGTYNVTAGVAYFPTAGGVIAEFSSASGITPYSAGGGNLIYIKLENVVTTQKTFFDSVDKDYSETYSATIVTSPPILSEYTSVDLDVYDKFPSLQWVLEQIDAKIDSTSGGLVTKSYDIGTWNMDTTASADIVIPTGAAYPTKDQIIQVDAIIREDSTASRQQFKIDYWDTAAGACAGSVEIIENDADDGFRIRLKRTASALFDGTRFDGTSVSRGWVIVVFAPDTGYLPY